MKWWIILAAAVSLASAQTPFSRRAPGFSLPDMQLKQHDLADYKGKVVMIDFMRTDCPKCRALTGMLEQLKKQYGTKLAVLSVVAPPENQNTVGAYIKALNVTSPILFDCGQMTASYLRVTPDKPTVHLPRLMLIDENGFIRRDLDGDADAGEFNVLTLSRSIDAILGAKK